MSYESPVKLIRRMVEEAAKSMDGEIFTAVYKVVPHVDKEELLRALRYDRGQYDKGFADGKTAAMDELVRCKDCKHSYKIEDAFGESWVCHRKEVTQGVSSDHFCSYGERRSDD